MSEIGGVENISIKKTDGIILRGTVRVEKIT